MRLLIIQPTYYSNGSTRFLYKTKKCALVGLTLPYLAALTPREWHVTLVDEQVGEIDFDAPADLVGEDLWEPMLADAAAGRLDNVYRAKRQHPLRDLPVPRYELVDFRPYGMFRTYAVQSSRGCPFRCEFCSDGGARPAQDSLVDTLDGVPMLR